MTNIQQAFLAIHHPAFRRGYQKGRQHGFREQTLLTDKYLVEYLQEIFKECEQEEGHDRQEAVYYAVGHLVGLMSTRVIPRQAHEDNTPDLQEKFLAKVMQEYGVTGQALISTIRQFWAAQDQLALTLDADTFEVMLHRGAEGGN